LSSALTKHGFSPVEKAGVEQIKEGNELLVRALLTHNVAPWFLESEEFKAYVKYITRVVFVSPSRYTFHQTVKDLSTRAAAKIKDMLVNQSTFISFEEDSWSHGRHYSGITAGSQGTSVFVGCFDVESGVESAPAQAAAINRCMLSALRKDSELGKHHPGIPVGKVAGMTSDTTNVMLATSQALLQYNLFKGMMWTPCSAHTKPLHTRSDYHKASERLSSQGKHGCKHVQRRAASGTVPRVRLRL
jgi:hypothetical protein